MSRYKNIFFDLDGTLIKSEIGVIDSVIYALEKLGEDKREREELKKFIGPPLHYSFTTFIGLDSDRADLGIKYYREHYDREGVYLTPLFEGIGELLKKLHSEGYKLYIVTSKPCDLAITVADNTAIREYLESVIGPPRSEKHADKALLIEEALRQVIEAENKDKAQMHEEDFKEALKRVKGESLMVGDRCYDIDAAVKVGLDSLGVLYGYGSLEEFKRSGADYLAESPEDIYEIIKKQE
ncbi:MAG: HAD hydrolase-like protein [Lachnospiraceae bacterium]|nr:HAD hydrolase-like protein [Lachnospiraceae bacterium]